MIIVKISYYYVSSIVLGMFVSTISNQTMIIQTMGAHAGFFQEVFQHSFQHLAFPFRDVVLDLPLGPLLLSVRPWCCRSADVRDAAEASARESHLRYRCQHRISGFRDWSDDH